MNLTTYSVIFLWAAQACAQTTALPLGGTNGNVAACVKYGNTLYVGGFFSRAGAITGSCVALDANSGGLLPNLPRFHGPVHSIVADGRGGWFVGGEFTAVDGMPHGPLAHLDAELRLLPWDPKPDDAVLALAVRGDIVVAGGRFRRVGARLRQHLAAFRVDEESPMASLAEPDGWVRALLMDGDRLYAAGDFDSVGGEHRGAVVAFEMNRLELSPWRPQLEGPQIVAGTIRALAKLGDDLLLGGRFYPSVRVGAVSTISGEFRSWSPQVSGPESNTYYGAVTVDALVVQDTSVYLGGHFTSVSGLRRGGLAKVGYPSGVVSSWDPDPGPWFGEENSDVRALYLRDGRLYLAGWFYQLGDTARSYLAAVDTESGRALPWNPGASAPSFALAGQGEVILAGGMFHGAGGTWSELRRGLAAFDLQTGQLKSWNPPAFSGLGVNTLAVSGGRVFVGGYFDALGGRSRYCLGAVDTLTGEATDWDPSCTGPVLALRTVGDTLYVGGGFGSLAGQPRSCVGAYDIRGGTLLEWAPVADDAVRAIEPQGGRVFVGGDFGVVNGVRRPALVSIDRASAELLPFDARFPSATINSITSRGDTLYIGGGGFLTVGGEPRVGVAALDASSGAVLDWRAEPSGLVTAVATVDTVVFVGGAFPSVSGVPRFGLAALSITTGAVLPIDPGLNGTVWSMAAFDGTLFAGGGFNEGLGEVRASLIGINFGSAPPPTPTPTTSSLALSPPWPNPASDHALLEFALPSADLISLAVFDLQGRIVLPVLERTMFPAGRHQISVSTQRLAKGFYVCRVRSGGGTAAQKLMVFR